MLRATDRLNEAEFFLGKLKETGEKDPEFRYYLSALLSASRSITLVLQEDLRPKYGEKFNEWWESRRESVSHGPFSFGTIRNLRNVFQKKGSRLPLLFKSEDSDEKSGTAEITWDPSRGSEGLEKLVINFPPGITIKLEDVQGESKEELDERLTAKVMEIDSDLYSDVLKRQLESGLKLSGFVLSDDVPPLPFDSIVEGFSNYLASVRIVVEEAEREFPFKLAKE